MSSPEGNTDGLQVEEATISGIHDAILQRRCTASVLVRAYLQRIDAFDQKGPRINAIVNMNKQALEHAERLDRAFAYTGKLTGPLHGIPVLVKDCIETEDLPTAFGSIAMSGYRPKRDATVIRNLREAGAIILAKTTLPDFASSWWAYSSISGDTCNPYALDRDPGGSSSGTGAGVAANFGTVGLGADCGGSIRVPASFDNLVGVRSTPGIVSRNGTSPLVFFQDTIGPMARTVTDAAIVMDTLVGFDPMDSLTYAYAISRPPKSYTQSLLSDGLNRARIGLVTNALGSDTDPSMAQVNAVILSAIQTMQRLGAEVVEVEIPDLKDHIEATALYITCCKAQINAFLADRPDSPVQTLEDIYDSRRYDPRLDQLEEYVSRGPSHPEDDPDYYKRLVAREFFTRKLLNILVSKRLDAFVYPTVQVAAPTREQIDAGRWTTSTLPTNTQMAAQAWIPAITVPAGFTDDGLPVGLEFAVKLYDEPTAFRLAYAFEQGTRCRRLPESTPALATVER